MHKLQAARCGFKKVPGSFEPLTGCAISLTAHCRVLCCMVPGGCRTLAVVSPLLLMLWLLEVLPAHQVPTQTTTSMPQCLLRGKASSTSCRM